MSESTSLVHVHELIVENRDYVKPHRLQNVSFRVDRGDSIHIRGANGSGKSTLLKCVAGIIKHGGTVSFGADVLAARRGWLNGIGYMPPDYYGPEAMSGEDTISLVRAMRGTNFDCEWVNFLLFDICGLNRNQMAQKVSRYSTGMKKKLGVSIALAHRPRLLLLDEPFESVDVETVARMDNLIGSYVKSGMKGAIVATHVPDRTFANRVIELDAGQVSRMLSGGHDCST